jgi:exopolyphosphatase/guanosine-5'-triphosphate,3'-diphosphate pyrophosphatase
MTTTTAKTMRPRAGTAARRQAALARARALEFEEGHSLQDERTALRLFDEASRVKLHKMGPEERELLSLAAILHDVGYAVGYEEHHKHAYRLILEEPIPGLSPHRQELVAQVARYHRGALPDPDKHRAFAALDKPDRELVAQLGAILRLADGLDRSHTNAVQDLTLALVGDRLVLTLAPGRADADERWAGGKKGRFFEQVFGVQLEIR